MRKIIYTRVVLLISLIGYTDVFSQVTITGPTCVVPGTVYQYTISGNWDSTSTMNICINGGAIYDSIDSNECTPTGRPVAKVVADWDTSGTWSLTLTSSSGNTTLNVSVTAPLAGGIIDSASKTQMIGIDSIPAGIICSAASGGSCSASYSYQWQQSSDIVSWTDMPGATGQNLTIDSSLTQSVYYRRKVFENTSGSLGYSDVAVIFVVNATAALDQSGNNSADGTSGSFNLLRSVNVNDGSFFNNNPGTEKPGQVVYDEGIQKKLYGVKTLIYKCIYGG